MDSPIYVRLTKGRIKLVTKSGKTIATTPNKTAEDAQHLRRVALCFNALLSFSTDEINSFRFVKGTKIDDSSIF